MKQIKFRGKTHGGHAYYGDLNQDFATPAIGGHGMYYEVEPESVAQLVGITSNGKEIYEGDEVTDYTGRKLKARYKGVLVDAENPDDVSKWLIGDVVQVYEEIYEGNKI